MNTHIFIKPYNDDLHQIVYELNYFLATGDFCHLLINYANSLDPDQDRQNNSGFKPFETLMVFLKVFFFLSKTLILSSQQTTIPSKQKVYFFLIALFREDND